MDVFKLFEWNNSLEAVAKLETLLQCSNCKDIAYDAKCLGCEHFFCLKCVETITNGTCPKCKSSGPPSEFKTDPIVANLVTSAKDLRELLDHGERVNLGKGSVSSSSRTQKGYTKSSKSLERGNSKVTDTTSRDKYARTKSGLKKSKKELSKVKNKRKTF